MDLEQTCKCTREMSCQMNLIHAELVQCDYLNSSEQNTKRLRHGCRIGLEGDRK